MQSQETKRIVLVGGGHCNCQILKLLKKSILECTEQPLSMTIVSEKSSSYYSGMLPGTVANLYAEDDLKVWLAPLAAWCNANFIEQRVDKIVGAENKLYLENGDTVDYDILVLNLGSITRDTSNVKGVWEHSLTTRPINDLIDKIKEKEQQLKEAKIVPKVVVCGAGAAGTELSYGFKKRWAAFFGQDIDITLVAARAEPLATEHAETKNEVRKKLQEYGITVETNQRVEEIQKDKVILQDGREIPCDVAIWATGADPQAVSAKSDLELLKGFIKVNDFMQSTSHPNVFAGGDCVTMENYADASYPTKAGVYAVRAGPIMAQNVMQYAQGKPLVKYVPQAGFLSLLMTGDESAIGSKHGICFVGKWVWKLKDYIDMSFMNLFNPINLFKDYKNQGTKEQLPSFQMFEDISEEQKQIIQQFKDKVKVMDPVTAAEILGCPQDEEEFQERWQILQRMHADLEFREGVVKSYKPAYLSN